MYLGHCDIMLPFIAIVLRYNSYGYFLTSSSRTVRLINFPMMISSLLLLLAVQHSVHDIKQSIKQLIASIILDLYLYDARQQVCVWQ